MHCYYTSDNTTFELKVDYITDQEFQLTEISHTVFIVRLLQVMYCISHVVTNEGYTITTRQMNISSRSTTINVCLSPITSPLYHVTTVCNVSSTNHSDLG